jgi:5-(carboxyamino)imidazole ribonucleotide synthase
MSCSALLPGGRLGIIGAGQLGRMLTIAAASMGYRVVVLSPDAEEPAAQLAHEVVIGRYDDPQALARLAEKSDRLTLEFENIPAEPLYALSSQIEIAPSPCILAVAQDRILEKTTLTRLGLPITEFRPIHSPTDGDAVANSLGLPLVIKTSKSGYDGKGQRFVRTPNELADAISALGPGPLVAERWVEFRGEASILVARSAAGEVVTYPLIANEHRHHILDLSLCPADVPPSLAQAARAIAESIADGLQLVGLLCVELFITQDDRLLVNELAPRPHNSGHLTIEAFSCSQFSQAVRAVCGLPLADPVQLRPAAMANLLGEQWSDGEPDWSAALSHAGVSLHLYGKLEPKPGRKMGHLTALADDLETAKRRVLAARSALRSGRPG